MSADLQRIRAFNRTVAQRLGVLNEKHLGRDRPYLGSRLLFEIGRQGAEYTLCAHDSGWNPGISAACCAHWSEKGWRAHDLP